MNGKPDPHAFRLACCVTGEEPLDANSEERLRDLEPSDRRKVRLLVRAMEAHMLAGRAGLGPAQAGAPPAAAAT